MTTEPSADRKTATMGHFEGVALSVPASANPPIAVAATAEPPAAKRSPNGTPPVTAVAPASSTDAPPVPSSEAPTHVNGSGHPTPVGTKRANDSEKASATPPPPQAFAVQVLKQNAAMPGTPPTYITVQGQQMVALPPGTTPPPGATILLAAQPAPPPPAPLQIPAPAPAGNVLPPSPVTQLPPFSNMTGMMAQIHLNPTAVPPPVTILSPGNQPTPSWSTPVLESLSVDPATLTDQLRVALRKLDAITAQAVKERNQMAEVARCLVADGTRMRDVGRRYLAIVKQLQGMVPVHVQVGVRMDLEEIGRIANDNSFLSQTPTQVNPSTPASGTIPVMPMVTSVPAPGIIKRGKTQSPPGESAKRRKESDDENKRRTTPSLSTSTSTTFPRSTGSSSSMSGAAALPSPTTPSGVTFAATNAAPPPHMPTPNASCASLSTTASSSTAVGLVVAQPPPVQQPPPPPPQQQPPQPPMPHPNAPMAGVLSAPPPQPQPAPAPAMQLIPAPAKLPKTLTLHSHIDNADVVCAMALSRPFKYLFTSSCGTIKIWDATQPTPSIVVASIECSAKSYIRALRITPDGKTLLAAGEFQEMAVCDIGVEKPVVVGRIPTPGVDTYSICVTADGRRAVTGGSDHGVHVWDVAGRCLIKTLKGHSAPVTSCTLSKDNQRIYSGSIDNTVRVWSLETGEPLEVFTFSSHVYSVDLDPLGLVLSAGLKDSIAHRPLHPPSPNSTPLAAAPHQTVPVEGCSWPTLRYHRGGGWFAGANTMGRLQVFRASDGALCGEVAEGEAILCAEVSACGGWVVTGGSGGGANVYRVAYE
ncbi:hypothetical protein HDU96_006442 [Phlyctochytrium bullatum]|nr:hypothetical protein HDU96_006442 [Phlyctochytrium bullatum]